MESRVATINDADLTLEKRILSGGDEGAEEYLLTSWFYRGMEAIRNARLANGLTQRDVAEKLRTTQSVVARLENAHRGTFSLERFLRYAWACGAAPLDFAHVAPAELRQFAAHDPGAPRTAEAIRNWQLADALRPWQLSVGGELTITDPSGNPFTCTFSFEKPGVTTTSAAPRETAVSTWDQREPGRLGEPASQPWPTAWFGNGYEATTVSRDEGRRREIAPVLIDRSAA